MKSNNIIEINGRRYDARTGQPLDKKQPVKKVIAGAGTFIDGYRKQQPKASNTPQKTATTRSAPSHISHKAAPSTTLKRGAVKKPQLASESTHTKPIVKTPKTHDESRFTRASQIVKSSAISKFHVSSNKTNQDSGVNTPRSGSQHTSQNSHTSVSKKEQLISQALEAANSHAPHKTTKNKTHRSRKFGRLATSFAVFALLAGYVAYLNMPNISMRFAAQRAGFAATLPSYRPSGYSLNGPIAHSSGQVVINFRSNTDGRKFSLKQQPTTWDSTALVENYVTKQSPSYLTYQDSGLTIYIYDGSSAAWVNNGKLYNIDGQNSELDSDQLLKIATNV